MKIWAVANQKGGVGKTTTVVSLGGHLSTQGYKTLLIDMDPHGSMTAYFGMDPDKISKSLYQLFHSKNRLSSLELQANIYTTRFRNLSIMPASTALATLDRQLSGIQGMGLVIANSLAELYAEYDFVIIDVPPQLGVLMVNALAACEQLIIPVQTEFLALKGLERMLHTLTMINHVKRKKKLHYTILPTMYDCRTKASINTLQKLKEKYPGEIWHSMIPVDTQFREASRLGVPLSLWRPKDRGSLAYGELLEYLIDIQDQLYNSVAAS